MSLEDKPDRADSALGLLPQDDLRARGRRFDVKDGGTELAGDLGGDEHIQVRCLRGLVAGLRTDHGLKCEGLTTVIHDCCSDPHGRGGIGLLRRFAFVQNRSLQHGDCGVGDLEHD